MILYVINHSNKSLPLYVYHLFLYFCLKTKVINFDSLNRYGFILKYSELLSLILIDNYDYNKLLKKDNNDYYFPFSKMKIKKIFNNIETFGNI